MSGLPTSPGGQAQDDPASTSATSELEHRGPSSDGGSTFGLLPGQPRILSLSRPSSRGVTPLQSGRATPSALEAVFHSDMATFRDGQVLAQASMERYMAQNSQVLAAMMSSHATFLIDLE